MQTFLERFSCDSCNSAFENGFTVRGAIEEIKDSKGVYHKCLLGDAIPGNTKHYCYNCMKFKILGLE